MKISSIYRHYQYSNDILSTFYQSSSSEVDGKVTVAFLPSMNVVSGLLQDGELTHELSIKVPSSGLLFFIKLCPCFSALSFDNKIHVV